MISRGCYDLSDIGPRWERQPARRSVDSVASAERHGRASHRHFDNLRTNVKKRRRQGLTRVSKTPIVPGIGWYSREQYRRLIEVSEDAENMSPTWEDWEANARKLLSTLRSEGIPARELPIDVEEMISWCRAQGKPVNGAARDEFISLKCRELLGKNARTE
jgi:hypothetical protein